jgi:outer membrane lipoprotein-sorting protein
MFESRLFSVLLPLALFIVCSPLPGSAEAQTTEPLESFSEIYPRSKAVMESFDTFRARFTETTTSSLLVQPLVARGTMVGRRPVRLELNYESPEKRTVFVDGNRLRMTWPDRGEEQELNITDTQKAVDRYFTRASEEDLRGHFDIEVLADPDLPHTYLIDMAPRRKQILQGLAHLRLWLDRDTLLMVRMQMDFPSGETKLIELEDIVTEVTEVPGMKK